MKCNAILLNSSVQSIENTISEPLGLGGWNSQN